MKDTYNDEVTVQLLPVADLAYTDTQSNYVDLSGYDGADFYVVVGALTGVDGSNYLTPTLQEASATPGTAGSYSAVAAGDIMGGFTKIDSTSEDSVVQKAGYAGGSRYVNVLLNYTGTGISAGYVGVFATLRKLRKGPGSSKTPTTGTVS